MRTARMYRVSFNFNRSIYRVLLACASVHVVLRHNCRPKGYIGIDVLLDDITCCAWLRVY